MKKIISLILCILFCFNINYAIDIANLENDAKACTLISAGSGQILYQKNGEVKLPTASTSKILTAIIIIETMDLDSEVTASDQFVNPGGSHIAIDHGETMKVKDLLYALLLQSANDAAEVLAEANAGTIAEFADKMNQKAIEIGAKNSHFSNPSGLDNENHYSTSNDMALIAAYAMKNPIFREIVKTTSYTIAPTNKKTEPRNYIANHNLFLLDNGEKMQYNGAEIKIFDERIDGIKTGYTDNAGNCLVSTLSTEGSRYIAVVYGAGSQRSLYQSSKTLLDYGSENYKRVRVIEKGAVIKNIKVKGAESTGLNLVSSESVTLSLPLADEESPTLTPEIEEYECSSPIKMGALMGKATYHLPDGSSFSVDLLAQRDIKNVSFIGDLTEVLAAKKSINSYLDLLVIIVKLCLVFIIWRWIIGILRRRRAKKRRESKIAEIKAQDNNNKDNVVDFTALKNHKHSK